LRTQQQEQQQEQRYMLQLQLQLRFTSSAMQSKHSKVGSSKTAAANGERQLLK
jgi:hypothetical protein